MALLIQVPNWGHEVLAWISLYISLVYWCIHSAFIKGSRTLFWQWCQRERLEQPGSVVTRGEGAPTQKLTAVMSPPRHKQTERAQQSVGAWNVLGIQEKNWYFGQKRWLLPVWRGCWGHSVRSLLVVSRCGKTKVQMWACGMGPAWV